MSPKVSLSVGVDRANGEQRMAGRVPRPVTSSPADGDVGCGGATFMPVCLELGGLVA